MNGVKFQHSAETSRLTLRFGAAAIALLAFTFARAPELPFGMDGVFGVTEAHAQRTRDDDQSTEGQGVTSQAVADAYNEALELFNAGQSDAAIQRLRGVLDGASEFELSLVYRLMGQIEIDRDNFSAAGDYFRRAIDSGGLEGDDLAQLYLILGQIYTAAERYADAIAVLEEYFRVVEVPDPQAYFALAQVYAVQDRFREAIPYAEQAVQRAPDFRETYVRLLMGLYLTEDRFTDALPHAQALVAYDPTNDNYWSTTGGIYAQLGREQESFAIYQFRYMMGFLDSSEELVRLAQSWMYYDVPYKAAEFLQEQLDAGNVEGTADNWELLGNAWFAARHFDRSRSALIRAANLSPRGNIYYRIAGTQIQDEDWASAQRNLERAINRGSLDDPGLAWLLLGHSRFNQDNIDGAEDAFRQALNYNDTREDAETWLTVLENRRVADEARRAEREAYEADADALIDQQTRAVNLAETARGLAEEALTTVQVAMEASPSERTGLIETATEALEAAQQAEAAANALEFAPPADVREEVRSIASSARQQGQDEFAENLEEQSEALLASREAALTATEQYLRDAEDMIFEARDL